MNKLYFITGASGSGKTTAAKDLEKELPEVVFCYFDSIGVPTKDQMQGKYGSGENWQKATTFFWVKQIKNKYLAEKPAVLDGQMRLSYIEDACIKEGVNNYEIILFDCSDEERKRRLTERGHPELANEEMMSWAKYLRQEAKAAKSTVVDTTKLSRQENIQKLKALLNQI